LPEVGESPKNGGSLTPFWRKHIRSRLEIGVLVLLSALLGPTFPALAHTTSNAFVLLLPTGYYLAGGTLAVALSVVVVFLVPARLLADGLHRRLQFGSIPVPPPLWTSTAAAIGLILLILAGLQGDPDPRANPLPIAVWSLLWVGFTFLQALLGDLWHFCNPWHAPYRLLRRLTGARDGWCAYPSWLGYWPAVVGFFAIAWFELVDLAPDDPTRLATAVLAYWAITLIGMLLFGEAAWLARGEAITVFLRFMAALSPFATAEIASTGRRSLSLGLPGARLLQFGPLPFDGICFVLLTLGTVSFDGLSKTFWWLALDGINPLEFPGRSAVVTLNTFGLLTLWLMLVVCYVLCCGKEQARAGRLALSIIPIALAYHFAHYLTVLLVDGQYALKVASDPLGLGWNLFGTAGLYVTTSFLSTYHSVVMIWNLQAGAIVLGHVVAIVLAQAMHNTGGGQRWSHLPLAVLMILYTLFGLWLMSTPSAG
jgi:hypothetical protein